MRMTTKRTSSSSASACLSPSNPVPRRRNRSWSISFLLLSRSAARRCNRSLHICVSTDDSGTAAVVGRAYRVGREDEGVGEEFKYAEGEDDGLSGEDGRRGG